MWLPRCCYAVAMVPWVVARVLLGYPGWLLSVAMQLLRYPGWLLGCCYAVARVTQGGCQGVAMRLLWYLGWFLGCC